jgi:drug/metabolite transporter (DMT)-like permease
VPATQTVPTDAARAAELTAGTGFTLLAALGFAAVSTLTSVALGEHISLYNVLTWRYVLSSVAMTLWVGTQNYPRMPWPQAARFIIVGGGGQALLVGLALSSLQYVTAATLGFLFYTYPAWVALVQAARGKEPLTLRRAAALALSFGGIAVIVGKPGALPIQGLALALGAAIVYGIYIPVMSTMQKSYPIPVTGAYAKIGSAICFLVLSGATQTFTWQMTPTAWGAIAALTLFSTVLPSVFFLMGLVRLGPVRTAIVSTVEPFLTAVLGAVVLSQSLTISTVIGGAMIVGAVVLLQVRRDRVA